MLLMEVETKLPNNESKGAIALETHTVFSVSNIKTTDQNNRQIEEIISTIAADKLAAMLNSAQDTARFVGCLILVFLNQFSWSVTLPVIFDLLCFACHIPRFVSAPRVHK